MDVEDVIVFASSMLTLSAVSLLKQKNKKRSTWVKEWKTPERRKACGAYHALMKELEISDPVALKNFVRMDKQTFEFLLDKVSPIISKKNTVMRECVPAAEKLAVTLRYLASGDSYGSMEYLFRIDKATISKFIPETCTAIYSVLKDYIQVPTTEKEWQDISKKFEERWNFPNCIGALDGKHVIVRHKRKYGSQCFNYKLVNSIVLFALVDADCNFIYIDVGTNGRVADSTIFSISELRGALENNALGIPPPSKLPMSNEILPYVIVADEAFPLKNYLMKPYPRRELSQLKKAFNYRLSRARRCVENAFGIMAARFQILQRANPLDITKVEEIVMACCALHNFLRKTSSANMYSPPDFFCRENVDSGEVHNAEWAEHNYAGIKDIVQQGTSFSSMKARNVRDQLCSYFNSIGKIPWQDKFIH